MKTDYEYAKEKLLDHYVNLQTDGQITEEEMERRMDRLEVIPMKQVVAMWRRLKKKRNE